jgi:hypothetical protein
MLPIMQGGGPQNGQSDAAFREYVEWYKVRVRYIEGADRLPQLPIAYVTAGVLIDTVSLLQGRVQQLAPLLVQAQFDVSSEAGKKITSIWAALVR